MSFHITSRQVLMWTVYRLSFYLSASLRIRSTTLSTLLPSNLICWLAIVYLRYNFNRTISKIANHSDKKYCFDGYH